MRLLRVCDEAHRPLPQFSPDDVVDFQVAEAILARRQAEQEKAEKEREREEWRKGHKGALTESAAAVAVS